MTWWHRINEFVHRQNPWVAVILAAVSILLAIYLARPEKGLLGYRQSIIKIFDNNSAGTLRIVGPNNQPIESDVYAIETTLGNAGNFTFDHVRRYPQIRFPKGTVVETRVSESTDPDIMHVTAVQGSQPDTVEVKWRNFDPDQLVKITTLVASAEEVKPEVRRPLWASGSRRLMRRTYRIQRPLPISSWEGLGWA